jgi:hypothetical protein
MPLSHFDIVARADSQTLIRLLNTFAQLGLRPSHVKAVEEDEVLAIRIDQPDLSEKQARIIAEKMRSFVLVETVRVRCGPHILAPLNGTINDISPE